jgi:hypothetical protein
MSPQKLSSPQTIPVQYEAQSAEYGVEVGEEDATAAFAVDEAPPEGRESEALGHSGGREKERNGI